MIKGFIVIMSLFVMLNSSALEVRSQNETKNFSQFPGRVPGLSPKMMYAEFWLANTPDAEAVLMTAEKIAAYNKLTIEKAPTLVDIELLPETINASQVRSMIEAGSVVPGSKRFYLDGRVLNDDDYRVYLDNLNLDNIASTVSVRYGLSVKRGVLRTFPTSDRVTNSGKDWEIDMFTETVLYPGEAVAVFHESKDKKWLLVQKYNYLAWAAADQIALGTKDEVLKYERSPLFLLMTGAKVRTVHNPVNEKLSEFELDMGCRVPLVVDPVYEIDRMGSDYCFTVLLPLRGANGELEIFPALIPRSADVNVGFLPYTRANIIRQAFKFLGERYGWGDDNNGRDCSGFVVNIFSCFGLIVPRNGGEQERDSVGMSFEMNNENKSEREEILHTLKCGDIISSPSHIMLFLGGYGGELWMIHDYIGAEYVVDGKEVEVYSRCVGISPILGYMIGGGRRYFETFTGIKRLILPAKGE